MPIGPSYGPNPGRSGGDPRGRIQNQGQYQQQRYEQQQGPMVNQMGYNYGRGSESDFNNYNDIMGRMGQMASGGGNIGYKDPFNSYGGFTEFSKTGGYSPSDIANMRARGVAPIRAAYGNAQREMGRQRSLQGGYSPNAVASIGRMAREQGQLGADATQNVEAGLAEARNRGRLAGLGGMAGIEGQRLGADLDVGRFNATNRAGALQGMAQLYGTTPGMSQVFGNQLLQGVNQGGQYGSEMMGHEIEGQKLPGAYDTTMGRVKDIYGTGSTMAYPFLDSIEKWWKNRQGGGRAATPVYDEHANE